MAGAVADGDDRAVADSYHLGAASLTSGRGRTPPARLGAMVEIAMAPGRDQAVSLRPRPDPRRPASPPQAWSSLSQRVFFATDVKPCSSWVSR